MGSEERRKQVQRSVRLVRQWKKTIGERIQDVRKDIGLNQEEGGAVMGWSKDIMGNIEKGRTEITVPELIVMAQMWGLSPEAVFKKLAEVHVKRRR